MSDTNELLFKDYPELDEKEKDSIMSVLDSVTKQMMNSTENYIEEMKKITEGGIAEKEAAPVTLGYPWWNILIYGPFQPFAATMPHKNMQSGDFSVIFGLLWMNPVGINGGPPPSAAQVMGAFNMRINFQTINLSTFVAGPPIPPVIMAPIGTWFGPQWLKPFVRLLGPGVFPIPPQGIPHKYELHVTADVSGPVPQPFFSGFSTWMFDPDLEPAIWPPMPVLPPALPAQPHWHFDVPCQFLVYRA